MLSRNTDAQQNRNISEYIEAQVIYLYDKSLCFNSRVINNIANVCEH